MSACEVLCWIGYRRAIPKEIYFAPLSEAPARSTTADLEACLHNAVPDPKPTVDPMTDAELHLMAALRVGAVRAISLRSKDSAIDLPVDAFRFHVTVNVRGHLEPDSACSRGDYQLAVAEPSYGELRFYTAEVLAFWPAHLINGENKTEKPAKMAQHPRPSDAAVALFYKTWRDARPDGSGTPTEKEIREAFSSSPHPGARISQIRAARDKHEATRNTRGRPKKA